MKIAIISDSHDNTPNIEKFLAWADKNQIGMIIHCGDIAAPSVISKLIGPKFDQPIHLIYGNVADRERLAEVIKKFKNITLHGDQGEITADGLKIAFCHFPDEARSLAATGRYNLVFYGHDHAPWEQKIGETTLYNPGTLAGMFNKATFAVYDTKIKQARLVILEKI